MKYTEVASLRPQEGTRTSNYALCVYLTTESNLPEHLYGQTYAKRVLSERTRFKLLMASGHATASCDLRRLCNEYRLGLD